MTHKPTINEFDSTFDKSSKKYNLFENSFTGNIIPHYWYHKITNSRGQPDSNAIIILAEIVYWYRVSKNSNSRKFYGSSLQLGYEHFENKLNFSRDQIRNALKKLEELNLVFRIFKTQTKFGSNYSNIMFLKLNYETLQNITYSNFNGKNEISGTEFSFKVKSSNKILFPPPLGKFTTPFLEISKDYKENNKNINNRSIKDNVSDFNKNLFEEKLESTSIDKLGQGQEIVPIALAPNNKITGNVTEQVSNTLRLRDSDSCINSIVPDSGMILKNSIQALQKVNRQSQPITYFLPLNSNDIDVLTKIVKKEFGSTFINALGQKLADKYPEHKFLNKEAFLKYIAIALTNEKHDPVKVNNINFAYISKTEQFLSKYEASNDISKIGQIKRRIAISPFFEPKLAEKILRSYGFPQIYPNSKKYKVYINMRDTELESAQVKEVISEIIKDVTTIINIETGEHFAIEEIIFEQGQNYNSYGLEASLAKGLTLEKEVLQDQEDQDIEKNTEITTSNNSKIFAGKAQHPIWIKVRQRLIEKYGLAFDKSWFNRFDLILNEEESRGVLYFENKFMRYWFNSNFADYVYQVLSQEVQTLEGIDHHIQNSGLLITDVWQSTRIFNDNNKDDNNINKLSIINMSEQSNTENLNFI